MLSELSTKGIHQAWGQAGTWDTLQAVEQRVQWLGALEKRSMSETRSAMKSQPRCSQGWGQPFEFPSISSAAVTEHLIGVHFPCGNREEDLWPFHRQIGATQEDPTGSDFCLVLYSVTCGLRECDKFHKITIYDVNQSLLFALSYFP